MRKILTPALSLAALGLAVPGQARAEEGAAIAIMNFEDIPEGDTTPIDYAKPDAWFCAPDAPGDVCTDGLDAQVVNADGTRTVETFAPAKDPPVDCFYIYPTISMDPTVASDLDMQREPEIVKEQLGRLSSVCRPFAPKYHQLTISSMIALEDFTPGTPVLDLKKPEALDVPFRDVRDAWAYYLAHYNKGRGVVLVAHSQGSMHMKRLLAEEIDGKPAQKLLVAAYLGGSLSFNRSSLKAIPPCAASDQTGCYLAWATYRDTEMGSWRMMGRAEPGTEPVCVAPNELDEADGTVKSYVPRPDGSVPGEPHFIAFTGQVEARCVTDARGSALSVHLVPGAEATPVLEKILTLWGELPPGIGMHDLDMTLVQGNIVSLIAKQTKAWTAAGKP